VLRRVEWIAGSAGSGFVSSCDCGFESQPHRDRVEALGEVSGHIAAAFSARRRPRWLRSRTPFVDLRDPIEVA
jgi:hypothetical protein